MFYDSNAYGDLQYKLNKELVGKRTDEFRTVFDNLIKEETKRERNIKEVKSLLEYSRFSHCSRSRLKYGITKYFLARIEEYLCNAIEEEMQKDVIYISTISSSKKGYHVEHIFSQNNENLNYFESEEEFNEERDRIGALLMLKGGDNISSGNELYEDKLKTYSRGTVWAKTLTENFYHKNSKIRVFNGERRSKNGTELKPIF